MAGSLAPDLDYAPYDPDEGDQPESTVPVRALWQTWFDELADAGRAVEVRVGEVGFGEVGVGEGTALWVAIERLADLRAAHESADLAVDACIPSRFDTTPEPDAAAVELVRGRPEIAGPIGVPRLASVLGLSPTTVTTALVALEVEGFAMRGRYSADAVGRGLGEEWCERRLLARIHRLTLDTLRARVRAVSPSAFVRFLGDLHRVTGPDRAEGIEGLARVIEQLQGCSAPIAAWEAHILPARVKDYEPEMLDMLCLSGRVVWMRANRRASISRRAASPRRR